MFDFLPNYDISNQKTFWTSNSSISSLQSYLSNILDDRNVDAKEKDNKNGTKEIEVNKRYCDLLQGGEFSSLEWRREEYTDEDKEESEMFVNDMLLEEMEIIKNLRVGKGIVYDSL